MSEHDSFSAFQDLWIHKLNEQQRKVRAESAFKITIAVAKKQMKLLENFIKNQEEGNLRSLYFFETVKSIWENVDFAISLGKGKNRRFAFYPARTVVENTFRLEHFSRQTSSMQEEIATKECLRISKRHYDLEMNNNDFGAAQKFKDYYSKFSQGKFIDIDTVDIKTLEPFPSMWQLTKNSKIDGAKEWYFHYQSLAEASHGKLLAISMSKQNEAQTYRLSLMYLLAMTNDVLKNTDFHLKNATRDEVVNAIKKAESIVKNPFK